MAKQRATTNDQLPMEVSDENEVGIDPHKKTLTATVLDGRGGTVATASFKVSGVGHRALLEWATRRCAAGGSRAPAGSADTPRSS